MNQITHTELVSALVKPGEVIAAEMTPSEADLWHGATGVSGESGELLEAALTAEITGSLDRENVIEELGDMEFYLEQMRQNLSISADEVLDFACQFQIGRDFFSAAAILAVGGSNLLDLAKKVAIYKKPVDRGDFLDALARIEVSLENIRRLLVIEREETLDGNIAKLSKRYASGSYSNAQAQTRADKEEGQ